MKQPPDKRPFLQIMYDCCRIYQRVYRHPSGTHYAGRCPKCLRSFRVEVGPGGTAARTFRVR